LFFQRAVYEELENFTHAFTAENPPAVYIPYSTAILHKQAYFFVEKQNALLEGEKMKTFKNLLMVVSVVLFSPLGSVFADASLIQWEKTFDGRKDGVK